MREAGSGAGEEEVRSDWRRIGAMKRNYDEIKNADKQPGRGTATGERCRVRVLSTYTILLSKQARLGNVGRREVKYTLHRCDSCAPIIFISISISNTYQIVRSRTHTPLKSLKRSLLLASFFAHSVRSSLLAFRRYSSSVIHLAEAKKILFLENDARKSGTVCPHRVA